MHPLLVNNYTGGGGGQGITSGGEQEVLIGGGSSAPKVDLHGDPWELAPALGDEFGI
jgi:hypothetical protein